MTASPARMSSGRSLRRRANVLAAALVFAGSASLAQTGSPDLPITAAAARAVGMKRCLSAIAAVSGRVTAGATHADVIADWDRTSPDSAAFFSLTGVEFGPRTAALSLTTAPEQSGGCSVLAERISGAPIPCEKVAQTELQGYESHKLLATITVYSNPKVPRETVTLVSTPPGCLLIRRQVQFGWPPS